MVRFSRRLFILVACLQLAARAAPAAEPISSGVPASFWEKAQHRATITADVGVGAVVAGSLALGIGAATQQGGLTFTGVLLYAASTPLIAGGGLRARTALVHRGLSLGAGLGIASWSLYGASLFLWGLTETGALMELGGTSPALDLWVYTNLGLSIAALLGSWVTGVGLLVREHQLDQSSTTTGGADAGCRGVTVALVPRVGPRSAGLALAGRF